MLRRTRRADLNWARCWANWRRAGSRGCWSRVGRRWKKRFCTKALRIGSRFSARRPWWVRAVAWHRHFPWKIMVLSDVAGLERTCWKATRPGPKTNPCSPELSQMSARSGTSRSAATRISSSPPILTYPASRLGASIACSGACMTVVDKGNDKDRWFAFTASGETLVKDHARRLEGGRSRQPRTRRCA